MDKKTTANDIKCWSQPSNQDKSVDFYTKRLKEMFIDSGQKKEINKGQYPAMRSVFKKQHGVVYGDFVINEDIPNKFKVGIFSGKEYPCVLRFSSDTGSQSRDLHSTIGVGIKLFGVEGEKLLGEGKTADFILQNINRFFAKDAKQMCSFTTAGAIDGDYDSYMEKPENSELREVLDEMKKEEGSCLSATYWAILPFKLGDSNIVKYRIVPEDTYAGTPFNDRDYLKLDLQSRLRNGSSTFRFEVQLRTNENEMPLDDAQNVWSTDESPYICIAKLHLPQQDITAIGQEEFGTNLSFNIWRTLEAHKPLGSIAEVRKVVYAEGAKVRDQANGQISQEPSVINPAFSSLTNDDDNCIVSARIYPPIGVMRVGNSEDEYFIGPLVDEPEKKEDVYAYRDKTGAIKRQAAQFRVYGFNAAGKPVKELTMDNAQITWSAHLANQKSSWYQFQIALDIPDANDPSIPPSALRNMDVSDRSKLLIDGGEKSISCKNSDGNTKFQGHFMNTCVYLGEMRTDDKGRLIMLGGHGKSENINGYKAITFANNEGWYDDISDGPITAEVSYNGVQLKVDPAWVICAPPDYAPMQKSVRTMWDLMRDVAVKSGMLKRPKRPSFTKDILPIFERMTNLQWVNAGFAAAFGWGGQFNYTSLEWVKRLNSPSPANLELRRTISNNFRRLDKSGAEAPQLWPWLYGDAVDVPSKGSTRQYSTLSDLQLEFLDQWVKGDFDSDFIDSSGCPHLSTFKNIDDYPVKEQPDMLTKAAMDFCLADAFHPGCEMTWPMRTSGMYSAAFRLKHAPKNIKSDNNNNKYYYNNTYYGPILTLETIGSDVGPLHGGQVAGGITRWMAIPWQTDTASCRDGYNSSYDPYIPTFWPARVPNNILSKDYYDKVLDESLSEETRREAFAYRRFWLDDLPLDGESPSQTNQINAMINYFDKLSIVQSQKGVTSDGNFPSEIQVGITPSEEQNNELIKSINSRLHEISAKNNISNEHKTAFDILKNHLNKKDQLVSDLHTVKSELKLLLNNDDKDITNEIVKLIKLLETENHKSKKTSTVSHLQKPRQETGIPERLVRFQRHILK